MAASMVSYEICAGGRLGDTIRDVLTRAVSGKPVDHHARTV
jgi:hypothetical protein